MYYTAVNVEREIKKKNDFYNEQQKEKRGPV